MTVGADLRRLIAETATGHHCPTIAWGVLRDGRLADGEHTDTVFRIASMTKSFTCAAVLALRDEGAFTLDEPVTRLVPELDGLHGPDGSPPITLRHLMQMTSGLATDDPWADRHLDIDTASLDALLRGGPTFAARTGDEFEYSNLGFGIIGRVVRRVTGVTVQQQVSERFLEPLGMDATTWLQPEHDGWARPHRVQDGRAVVDPLTPLGDGDIAPMGGLWSTVGDLSRWIAWLDDAVLHPTRTARWGLSTAARREMQRMHTYIGIAELAGHHSPAGYGFGLHIRDDATLGTVIAHSGGLPGYGSNMRWISGRAVGAIALANVTYAPMSALTLQMLHVLHQRGDVPSRPHPDAPLLDDAINRLVTLLHEWDDGVAAELFADNVDLDESFERRAAQAGELTSHHGRLLVERVVALRETSGEAILRGTTSDATVRLDVQLSPEPRPRVQWYRLRA